MTLDYHYKMEFDIVAEDDEDAADIDERIRALLTGLGATSIKQEVTEE